MNNPNPPLPTILSNPPKGYINMHTGDIFEEGFLVSPKKYPNEWTPGHESFIGMTLGIRSTFDYFYCKKI